MMPALTLRLTILAAVAATSFLMVWAGRGYVNARRARALAVPAPVPHEIVSLYEQGGGAKVNILAFTGEDCRQCHTMQTPALRRVREARPDAVAVTEVDALSRPDLTARYGVLTLPTTVVLDATGRARAVNYGFASTQKLLEQVNEALGATPVA